jgi:hypothetical protein
MLPLLIQSKKNITFFVHSSGIPLNAVRFINSSPIWQDLTSGGFQEDTIPLSQTQGPHCPGEAIHIQGTHFPEACHDSRLLLVVVVYAPPLAAFDIPAIKMFIKLIILGVIHRIFKLSQN